MVVLLDTVAIILAAKTPEKLSSRVVQILESPNDTRFLSTVSLVEIAVTRSAKLWTIWSFKSCQLLRNMHFGYSTSLFSIRIPSTAN
jgi:PIN domain nuclease of toxin-antitoxin system